MRLAEWVRRFEARSVTAMERNRPLAHLTDEELTEQAVAEGRTLLARLRAGERGQQLRSLLERFTTLPPV